MAHRNKEMIVIKEEAFILTDLQKHEAWYTMKQDRETWGCPTQVSGVGRKRKKEQEESMGLYCHFCGEGMHEAE